MTNSKFMRIILTTFILFLAFTCFGQDKQKADSLRKSYDADMKILSSALSEAYYPHRPEIYSLNESLFLKKVDSLKQPFMKMTNKYAVHFQKLDKNFIPNERREIEYFFDRIIQDYPYFHENHTGNKVKLSKSVQKKLDKHLPDFNNPTLLSISDVKGYIEGFLRHKSSDEVKKDIYKKSDNKRLDAYLNLIPKYFTNQECKEYWQYHYLFAHIDDWGTKNLDGIVSKFLITCKNEAYKKTIDSMYTESANARKDHLIKTYKTVDGYNLDIHIFLPDSIDKTKKSPVMVYFSGGSWTKGNPEWAFYSCDSYAKKGWVGVSVEYRLADRHETTPFEAVKDARSAIRWLRINADTYNIDTARIVATGNSAGGHLVLTTALANEWNEESDNLNYNATPNLLLVNAGVYSLYSESSTDWITRDLADKSLAKKISPIHLLRTGLPPMLIIHGTDDHSVDYASAKAFAEEMEKLGNDFEFHTLKGAPHAIWFDRRFSGKVSELRKAFLKKYGYE
ncbi:alpha/beta hydrolase [Arcicella rosea]|uniref:Acetyl esterase/lipase n=1 Tax=Arcicella rosea TaxID=502909 RepID=A0A841EDU9_9BACT|nr:alpha/beta hydrolase [Arcicella rosea]MBB6002327.1 acetyl esterase/lipase [Arcicella rosea]